MAKSINDAAEDKKTIIAAVERTGDAKCLRHLVGIQPKQPAGNDRGTEWAGQSGGMKAAGFDAMPRRYADAAQHFRPGNDRGEQVAAISADLLRRGQRRRDQHGTGVHAGPRLAQTVEFGGMRQHTIGQRGRLCRHSMRRRIRLADNAAGTRTALACQIQHNSAPRKIVAEHGGGDRVDQTVFCPAQHCRRDVLEAQRRRVFGQTARLTGHGNSIPSCDLRRPSRTPCDAAWRAIF